MKRSSFVIFFSSCLIIAVLALAGCSSSGATSQHQVVSSSVDCTTCHEEKDTYDLEAADVSGIVEVATTLTVQTDADSIVVANPVFIKEDGSKYVPRQRDQYTVSDGEATVELEEGVWVVCIDNGDSSTCIVVSASADGAETSVSL